MIIKQNSNFTPAPDGLHNAVCVDVVDLGSVETPWGNKPRIRLVWEIDATQDNGKRFLIFKSYTPSLHEKATLRKDLKAWRGGKDLTADELKGFEIEKLVGAPCQLLIQHNEKEGTVYANIAAITKAGESKLKPAGDYVRKQDRPEQEQSTAASTSWSQKSPVAKPSMALAPVEDMATDEIPF